MRTTCSTDCHFFNSLSGSLTMRWSSTRMSTFFLMTSGFPHVALGTKTPSAMSSCIWLTDFLRPRYCFRNSCSDWTRREGIMSIIDMYACPPLAEKYESEVGIFIILARVFFLTAAHGVRHWKILLRAIFLPRPWHGRRTNDLRQAIRHWYCHLSSCFRPTQCCSQYRNECRPPY